MNTNIFNGDELSEAFLTQYDGGMTIKDNKADLNQGSSPIVLGNATEDGKSVFTTDGFPIQTRSSEDGRLQPNGDLTGGVSNKNNNAGLVRHTRQTRNELVRGLGATASFNNLLLSAGIYGRPIGDIDAIEALHRMGPREIDDVMQQEDQFLGSYSFKRIANALTYADIRIHVRVLCFLVNHLNAQWKYEGKYLRLVRFARREKGLNAKVLETRNEGLYILFGYVNEDEECFVSYNAETGEIFNGYNGMVHNWCDEALEEIFPAGLRTVHELIVLEQTSVKMFRLHKQFNPPHFEEISRQTFNFLKDGEHGTDLMW